MKHSIKNLFYYAMAGVMLFSSCGQDDAETPAPTIKLKPVPSENTENGAVVSFPIEVAAAEKIDNIRITKKVDAGSEQPVTGYPKSDGFNTATSHTFIYDYTVVEESGKITLRFEVTDKLGKRDVVEHILNVIPKVVITPMAVEATGGIIANKIGPNQSAFDLAANVRRAGDSPDADMQNPTTTTTMWIKGWNGVRETTFVKANDFAYDDASVEAATEAFTAGTKLSAVTGVAVGDIYIANIKGGNNFAVIKVTHADNDIPAANTEEIRFTYKKVSANSGQ